MAQVIESMTGFGAAETSFGGELFSVSVRSVNSRFLDTLVRLPDEFLEIEGDVRELVTMLLRRGRVEITVRHEKVGVQAGGENSVLVFRREAFRKLKSHYFAELKAANCFEEESRAEALIAILGRKDVLSVTARELPSAKRKKLLLDLCRRALNETHLMRRREGKRLLREVTERLESIRQTRLKLSRLVEQNAPQQRQQLQARLEKLLSDKELDPRRFEQEVALLVDKVDVAEELSRLASHQEEFLRSLKPGEGKKLEFLLQEFGREFNTIGSKVQHAKIQQLVVGAKAEIERLKEQLQNIS